MILLALLTYETNMIFIRYK